MKFAITTFLIFCLIGIAIFGVFTMNHSSGHSHNGCVAATSQGVDCSKETDALSFINFHLDAFRSFSTAIFGDNLANALFLLIVLMLPITDGVIVNIRQTQPTLTTNYQRRRFLESYPFQFQRELTHWLALHENSPATS